MGSYENMFIAFSQTLSNEEAGISEGDEPPINGEIYLKGEKYNLNYLGNNFIFDFTQFSIGNIQEITSSNGWLQNRKILYLL